MLETEDMNLLEAKSVYMIGIKGTGMVSLAGILKSHGIEVSGSDVPETFFTDGVLRDMGIVVHQGFDKKHIKKTEIDVVIASAAYGGDHEEVLAATKKEIPFMYYPEALGQIFSEKYGIGITGTHGKTSTTAMMGIVLQTAMYRPTVVVGTQVQAFGGSHLIGESEYMVAELCEYRRHFLHSHPKAVILTNIEMDHPDYFKNIYDVYDAYVEFVSQISDDGLLVYAKSQELDDFVRNSHFSGRTLSYGISRGDVRALNLRVESGRQLFDVYHGDRLVEHFELRVPGRHQVLNACGVIALSLDIGVPVKDIKDGILAFGGLKRRTEFLGERNGVSFIDDYGHHPTEIQTTLAGLRDFYSDRRIWCVFQAHTYSRTLELLDEFGRCFGSADIVLVTDIFGSAREEKGGIDGDRLAFEIRRNHRGDVAYTPTFEDAAETLLEGMQEGDVVVCMGAGNTYKVAEIILGR